jgi:hypothetical protein
MIRSKLIGIFGSQIDYVARTRIRDCRKAEIWIKDQYYNPHESWHSIDEVMGWFRDNEVTYLNCSPAIIGAGCDRKSGSMFSLSDPRSQFARIATQLSWLGTISSEGALFAMVGRRDGVPLRELA